MCNLSLFRFKKYIPAVNVKLHLCLQGWLKRTRRDRLKKNKNKKKQRQKVKEQEKKNWRKKENVRRRRKCRKRRHVGVLDWRWPGTSTHQVWLCLYSPETATIWPVHNHINLSRNSRLKYMCKADCTVSVMLKCIRPGIIFPSGYTHLHPFKYICFPWILLAHVPLSCVSQRLRKPNVILWSAVTPAWEQDWEKESVNQTFITDGYNRCPLSPTPYTRKPSPLNIP